MDDPTARLENPMNEWRVLGGGMRQDVSDQFGDAVDFELPHGPAAVCINGPATDGQQRAVYCLHETDSNCILLMERKLRNTGPIHSTGKSD